MDWMNYPSIKEAWTYSNEKISELRTAISKSKKIDKTVGVVTLGSFARREASKCSDLDFFIVSEANISKEDSKVMCDEISRIAHRLGIRDPSPGGTFAQCATRSALLSKIGGADDSNKSLTLRMLFLLESEWLSGEAYYDKVFNDAVIRYIGDKITQHQLCLFLLNDIIRYYRTICVDFEQKTSGAGGKSWGDRNIKLMFSRKLLYFSGIIAVAETAQHTCTQKREILAGCLRKTPIERLSSICQGHTDQVLGRYNDFLSFLSDPKSRASLVGTTADRNDHTESFRLMKNGGHHFSWELDRLLSTVYHSGHPIHHALKF